jgi:ABC-type anion transport system duplicated permease subunit
MELSTLISLVTIIVTWILGVLSKKSTFINNKLIPMQNILIGVIVAGIEWIVTKDFSTAIALSGIIAGGTYDVFHNLEKIVKGE